MLVKRIGKLKQIMANLIQDKKYLEERLDSHEARLYTLKNLDIPQRVSKVVDEIVTDAIDWAIQAPLRNRFSDLPEADMKEILHQRIWETNSYKAHKDHMMLYEALKKSMNCDDTNELLKDLAEARKKKKKRRDSLKTPPGSPPHQPPPPSPPTGLSRTSGSPKASGSSQVPPPPPPPPSTNQEDLHMDDDLALAAQAHSSDDKDIRNAHIPKTGDMTMFMDWFCKRQGITKLKPQDLEVPAFELIKVFHPNVIHLQHQMEECHKLLTDCVDESIIRHNVSKLLPLGGPPGQMWIKEECKYNVAAIIEVFSMYGYTYMKRIVLRRVDLNKHIIAKRDFKYLYPSDFEDLYLLNLQGHLNHLPPKDKKILTTTVNLWTRHLVIKQRVKDFQLGIECYQTQLNLTKPRWDATGFEYKHDFTIIDSPRAVTFREKYVVQMIMRFNEIHKFSNDTLHQIDEALDYRVKEFKVNRMNPVDIEKVAVCPSLRSLKPKRTIESRAKRSSKIISLGHYSIMLATSHTVKSKTDIKSPTHYPRVGFNSLVHSLRALSTLRRFSLRTANAAAKPCQGDSLELYLIIGLNLFFYLDLYVILSFLRSSAILHIFSSSCNLLPSCDLVTFGPTCSYISLS
nr:hypothetical protein [Tanacetum cinerariifolium]